MSDQVDRTALPIRRPPFKGVANQTLGSSQRYNHFHVTAMCSPTLTPLPTGRNQHAVGMDGIPEISCDFPGFSAMLHNDRPGLGLPLGVTGADHHRRPAAQGIRPTSAQPSPSPLTDFIVPSPGRGDRPSSGGGPANASLVALDTGSLERRQDDA
jgi:hypothetical protein